MADINDDVLLAAIRKRLLDEIGKRGDAERIVNNVYGSMPQGGGITERLYQGDIASGGEEDPYQYFVDIDRDDKIDEEGKKTGWTKRVKRYRQQLPRSEGDPGKKKTRKTR